MPFTGDLEPDDARAELAACADVPKSTAQELSADEAAEALELRETIAEHEAALENPDRMSKHTRQMREASLKRCRSALADLAPDETPAAALAPSEDVVDESGGGNRIEDAALGESEDQIQRTKEKVTTLRERASVDEYLEFDRIRDEMRQAELAAGHEAVADRKRKEKWKELATLAAKHDIDLSEAVEQNLPREAAIDMSDDKE